MKIKFLRKYAWKILRIAREDLGVDEKLLDFLRQRIKYAYQTYDESIKIILNDFKSIKELAPVFKSFDAEMTLQGLYADRADELRRIVNESPDYKNR